MKKTFERTVAYNPTFRTEKITSMFDVPVQDKLVKEWTVEMPLTDKPWQLGLIVGPSGAGKSTIAKEFFQDFDYFENFDWDDRAIVDNFPDDMSALDIVNVLSSVGFSSPPNWLLPYSALSTGQRFRADLARTLASDKPKVIFDEFTSVIDRTVAKTTCIALKKYLKKIEKQFIAVSCHYDIIEWLQPDWVYDVETGSFCWRSLRRPPIKITIYRTNYKAWDAFKGHHYLSSNINKSAVCFVAVIEGKLAAFSSYINFCHPHIKKSKQAHRTVVLPDYQGFGLGNYLSDFVGEYVLNLGYRFFSTTSHPAFIYKRNKSPKWKMTKKPSIKMDKSTTGFELRLSKTRSIKRLTASFEYIGEPKC